MAFDTMWGRLSALADQTGWRCSLTDRPNGPWKTNYGHKGGSDSNAVRAKLDPDPAYRSTSSAAVHWKKEYFTPFYSVHNATSDLIQLGSVCRDRGQQPFSTGSEVRGANKIGLALNFVICSVISTGQACSRTTIPRRYGVVVLSTIVTDYRSRHYGPQTQACIYSHCPRRVGRQPAMHFRPNNALAALPASGAGLRLN